MCSRRISGTIDDGGLSPREEGYTAVFTCRGIARVHPTCLYFGWSRRVGKWIARMWVGAVLAACFSSSPVMAAEGIASTAPSDDTIVVDPEDREQIETTTHAPELVRLARRLAIRGRDEAARLAIEKACRLDPALLEDDKRASPRRWRDVWFGYRAVLRERKLAPDDVSGRVKIAAWLHEAGLGLKARTMLRAALKLDPTHPEARALAEAWHLFGGGPFQFDLTCAVARTLFPESVHDEGQPLARAPQRQWMLLPFAYHVEDEPLDVYKISLRVIADGKYRCRVAGLMLMSSGTRRGSGPGEPPISEWELQPTSWPVWERIKVEPDESAGSQRVTAYNLVPARHRSRGYRGGEESARAGVLIEPKSGLAGGRAAFLLEIPEGARQLEVVFRDEIAALVDVPFIKGLSAIPDSALSAGTRWSVETLIEASRGANAVMAAVAVARLGMLRWQAAERPQPRREHDSAVEGAFDPEVIERALCAALAHPNEQVRRTAFDVLIDTPMLVSRSLLAMLAGSAEPPLLHRTLDLLEQVLGSAGETGGVSGTRLNPAGLAPGSVKDFPELEVSPVSNNLFLVLSACLASEHRDVVMRALDILLTDGSQQSAMVLMEAPMHVRSLLVDRLSHVEEGAFKAVLFRILALDADAEMLTRILDACQDMRLVIRDRDDPMLTILRRSLPPAVQARVVRLLVRADLSGVLAGRSTDPVWLTLADRARQDSELAAAMLDLAMQHFDGKYVSPFPKNPTALRRLERSSARMTDTFTTVLAILATGIEANEAVALTAARALLQVGRAGPLQEQIRKRLSSRQQARLIEQLSNDSSLQAGPVLAFFLAGCVDAKDPVVSETALEGLARLYHEADAEGRWQLNLAVKLMLPMDELVRLTLTKADRLARDAGSLLRQLGHLTPDEWDAVQAHSDPAGRMQALRELETVRAASPAGTYACLVCVDLEQPKRSAAQVRGADVQSWTSRLRPALPVAAGDDGENFENIPLIAAPVRVELAGDQGFRITCDRRPAGADAAAGGVVRAPRPGHFRLDGTVLLRSALERAEQDPRSIVRYVDRRFLANRAAFDLNHVVLGTWAGSFHVSSSPQPDPRMPIRIRGVRVFLEPISLDRPKQVQPK